jgi:hypothetical protein
MFMRPTNSALVILAVASLATGLSLREATADDRPPTGVWTIESAATAPWADGADTASADEPKRLIGKTVTFGLKAVQAPSPIGCVKPHYVTRQDGPDMLFQGALAEPDKNGKPRDAAALARELGMTSAKVTTYEIGCSEFEFHALTPGKLVFGLNDRVYTMRQMKPTPKDAGAQ